MREAQLRAREETLRGIRVAEEMARRELSSQKAAYESRIEALEAELVRAPGSPGVGAPTPAASPRRMRHVAPAASPRQTRRWRGGGRAERRSHPQPVASPPPCTWSPPRARPA